MGRCRLQFSGEKVQREQGCSSQGGHEYLVIFTPEVSLPESEGKGTEKQDFKR